MSQKILVIYNHLKKKKKKHLTDEPCSLEIYIKMLGMSWIHIIYVDTSLSLHRDKGTDI